MALASDVLPTSVRLHPWRLGFKQSSLSRIAQALQDHSIHIFRCSPLYQPCSCPLALSGLGQLFASESWTLNSGHLWWQFRLCVTRRTLSPHPAQHLWSFSMDIHEASVPISPAPQEFTRGQLARSLGTFVPVFPRLGAFAMVHILVCTAFPCSDYYAPSDTAWASEFRWGLPSYSPPSFASLRKSPVFPMEDSNKTR